MRKGVLLLRLTFLAVVIRIVDGMPIYTSAVRGSFTGSSHDKVIFENSFSRLLKPRELTLGDGAYRGLPNVLIPHCGGKKLSSLEKEWNKAFSLTRVLVERVIGLIKRFRVISSQFRGDLEDHHKWFLLCFVFTKLQIKKWELNHPAPIIYMMVFITEWSLFTR